MQVARRSIIAAAVIIGLGIALAVVCLRLRALAAEHAELTRTSRQVCHARLWELRSLLPPYRRTDQRNRYEAEQRLIDPQVFEMCLGMDFLVSTSDAELCWILHPDDPRSRHCFDALLDGLWCLYRFRAEIAE